MVRAKDVLVLDLKPFRSQPAAARKFVRERAGEFRLASTSPEEIITRSRPPKDRGGLVRRAQKLGSEKGCDLVLVLRTGPYFGRQRNAQARIRERGYAFVVMGRRAAGNP